MISIASIEKDLSNLIPHAKLQRVSSHLHAMRLTVGYTVAITTMMEQRYE
jgi:hypothetical protein